MVKNSSGLNKNKKIGCVIYHSGEIYSKMSQNLVSSLERLHPEVDIIEVNTTQLPQYKFWHNSNLRMIMCQGVVKYFIAYEHMLSGEYDGILCLGADTIVTGDLSEMLYESSADICVTLDYPSMPVIPFRKEDNISCVKLPIIAIDNDTQDQALKNYSTGPDLLQYEKRYKSKSLTTDVAYFNADVVCFFSAPVIREILDHYVHHYEACCTPAGRKLLASYFVALPYPDDTWVTQEELDHLSKAAAKSLKIPWEIETHSQLREWATRERKRDSIAYYHFLGEQGALNITTSFSMGAPGANDRYGKYTVAILDTPLIPKYVFNVRALGVNPTALNSPNERWKNLPDFYIEEDKLFNHMGIEVKIWHYCAALSRVSTEQEGVELLESINARFSDDVRDFFTNKLGTSNFFESDGR
tara:strand:+ start:36 stop:1274 length:1239 start_codon:yes stop_codon:yes gene_type:complete